MKKIFFVFGMFLLISFGASAEIYLPPPEGGGDTNWHSFDDYVKPFYQWDSLTSSQYKSTYNAISAEFTYVEKGMDLTTREGSSNIIDTCNRPWASAGSTSSYRVCDANKAPTSRYIVLIGRQPIYTVSSGIVQGKWIED